MGIFEWLFRKQKGPSPGPKGSEASLVDSAIARLSNGSDEARVPIAMELLRSSDYRVKAAVASEAARLQIRAVGVWYELANALADEHEEVRLESAKAFWKLSGADYAIRSLRDEYENPAHMGKKDALRGLYALKKTVDDVSTLEELLKSNWKDCPTVEMEIETLTDAKGTNESSKILSELVKNSDPRVRAAVSSEALRLGLSDSNSRAWTSIAKLLADENENVRNVTAMIYWKREKEYKGSELDPLGHHTPVKIAINVLETHFEFGRLTRQEAIRGLFSLVDTAPSSPLFHLFDPMMGKYAHVANRSKIFEWEEVQNEMHKRINNFL